MIESYSLHFSRMHISIPLVLSKAGVYRYPPEALENSHV